MRHLITAACASLCSVAAFAAEHAFSVEVRNSWSVAKTDEPVVVRLCDVRGLAFDVSSAVVVRDGQEIPCQLDDMDGDSRPDELVFMASIDANATNAYTVTLSDTAPQREYEPLVWGTLVLRDRKDQHPRLTSVEAPGESNLFNDIHMHGAVLESQLVGWRIYFDNRQNLDLYGKPHRRIEIPTTEFYTTPEQLQQGYGVDVLWAGGAIGCGTLRGWNDGPTLLDDVKVRGQRIVTSGPVRTVVEVTDRGWRVRPTDAKRLNVRQLYIQYAGRRDLEVRVQTDLPLDDPSLCTGVQKVGVNATDSVRHGHASVGFVRNGIAASWGCDYPDMGKKQMWPPEAIGLATCVPTDWVVSQSESDLNYLLVLSKQNARSLTYHTAFCAAKEIDGPHTAAEWFAWVEQWQQSLRHPINMTIKTLKNK